MATATHFDINSLASVAVIIGFTWGSIELLDAWRRKRASRKEDKIVERVSDEVTDDIREIVSQVRTNGGSSLLDKVNQTSKDMVRVLSILEGSEKRLKQFKKLRKDLAEHLADHEASG